MRSLVQQYIYCLTCVAFGRVYASSNTRDWVLGVSAALKGVEVVNASHYARIKELSKLKVLEREISFEKEGQMTDRLIRIVFLLSAQILRVVPLFDWLGPIE